MKKPALFLGTFVLVFALLAFVFATVRAQTYANSSGTTGTTSVGSGTAATGTGAAGTSSSTPGLPNTGGGGAAALR